MSLSSNHNLCLVCLSIIVMFLFTEKLFSGTHAVHPFQVTEQILPDFEDSYGVVFHSINGDHKPDIYVVRFRNLNRFFLYEGPADNYMDWTIQSGLGGNLMPRGQKNLELGASAGDFDNDGLPDMMVAGWGESTRLFHQQKNSRFIDITASSGITAPLDGNGAFWADVNRDDDLDLFITDEHHANRLFLGNGLGNFQDVSSAWGLDDISVSQGATFGDLDGDGYPDLYVCNWFSPDILYRNVEGNTFQQMELNIGHLDRIMNSNGVSFGDIDNDGDLDILVTDRDGKSALYRNEITISDSIWHFIRIPDSAGFVVPYPAYGSIIADFDNDGMQDIWINCIGPNMLFKNEGKLNFVKVFEEQHKPFNEPGYYSTGAACADMDADGDLDLFVSNKDTISYLYRNFTNDKNYIRIRCVGVDCNRDAVGTRIWLYHHEQDAARKNLAGYREIVSSSGYLSQNEMVAHFGVDSNLVYFAKIIFPGGVEKQLANLIPGNIYEVHEYTGIAENVFRSYNYLYRVVNKSYFWISLGLYLVLILSVVIYTYISTRRYRWASRHIILFFSLTILFLYGIFIAFQEFSVHIRLITQILVLYLLLIFLTFFMEKIRRLEISRRNYRTLLREFSRELIFIKDSHELFEKLLFKVSEAVKPEYCAIYVKEKQKFRLLQGTGLFEAPSILEFSAENILEKTENKVTQKILSVYPECHLFWIRRNEQIYGLLVLGRPLHYRAYSAEDIEVFQSLTAQAAIAVENNLYIEKTKKLIMRVTEAETREKYLAELEKANQKLKTKNKELRKLYRDLQNTQGQLVQSEKMASLGQLVAGVAHELNNPISFIYANMKELENYTQAISELISLIKRSPETAGEDIPVEEFQKIRDRYDFDFIQHDILGLIRENIEGSQRVKEVVQNLRNFSRLDEAALKKVDIHEGLDSTLLLLNHELKNRIEVHKDYGDIPGILCHPGNINQVFMNIFLNAIQAIENKGNIWIKTGIKNGSVEITIRDDGKGIPKKDQNKIFDPFYTTKPVGKGTGLGLSISYNIIRQHRGRIHFDSREGKGTTFTILLPMQQ